MNNKNFQKTVWCFYDKNKRDKLPWRPKPTTKPLHKSWHYKILVSEIMLQQTQVDRVIPKFESWLKKFPSFEALANAPLRDVLIEWQGLGYNSRAKRLQETAKIVTTSYKGNLPSDNKQLLTLPGIGPYTAGAIMNFVFNSPTALIETNIRTVYFHHFFKGEQNISDKELLQSVEQTIDRSNPREWFYALMDYGSYLKREHGNNITKSKHYSKQSRFKGSNRELRSLILQYTLKHPKATVRQLAKNIDRPLENIQRNFDQMKKEGLL